MSDNDVIKKLKDLAEQIDDAKATSEETTKILERSERFVERATKAARLLDTSTPSRRRRRVGKKR